MKNKAIEIFQKIKEVIEERKDAPVFEVRKRIKGNPFKALVFGILSIRTKDENAIKAFDNLFSKIKDIRDLNKLSEKEIEELIKNVGLYRNKAKFLKQLAEKIVKEYNGKIPDKFEELIKLPGVGRKIANIVLSVGFGKDAIAVDTHVHRISNRIGLVNTKSPEETEEDLKKIFPRKLWKEINFYFVAFGQTICKPRKPKCGECPIKNYCKYYNEKVKKGDTKL